MRSGDAVVYKLTVARLFNLGNYEHERIEVEVRGRGHELYDGTLVESAIEHPAQVVTELRELLEKAKPVEMTYGAELGEKIERGILKVAQDGDSEAIGIDKQNAAAYGDELLAYRSKVESQKAAIARLNELGTVRIEGGAS